MAYYAEDETFENVVFSEERFPVGKYEYCTFINCDFTSAKLSFFQLEECTFENCNLSNVKLNQTQLKQVSFFDCKMVGVNFEDVSPFLFEMNLTQCDLNLSSFYKLPLQKCTFSKCDLKEVDFSSADLTGVSLDNCDLTSAIFSETVIEKTDFRTSTNYSINPRTNRLTGAKFSKDQVIGLLHDLQIIIE